MDVVPTSRHEVGPPWQVIAVASCLGSAGSALIGYALFADGRPDAVIGLAGGALILGLAIFPFLGGLAFASRLLTTPIALAWSGGDRLWKAFWVYFVAGGYSLGFLGARVGEEVLRSPTRMSGLTFLLLLPTVLIYLVWSLVALWRCAPNTHWRGWAILARTVVVVIALCAFAPLVALFAI